MQTQFPISQPVIYTEPSTLYHKNADGLKHDTVFNYDLEKFIKKAQNFALETLGQPRQPIMGREDNKPAPCACCSWLSGLLPSNSSTTYGYSHTSYGLGVGFGGGGGRDDGSGTACLLGVMAVSAAAAAFAYFFANYQNTRDEIDHKDEFGRYINAVNINPNDSSWENLGQIKSIFQEYTALLKQRLDRDTKYCFTAVAVLASGGVLFVGGMVSSAGMITVGGIALLSSTAYAIFLAVHAAQRKTNIPVIAHNILDRYEIIRKVNIAPNLL